MRAPKRVLPSGSDDHVEVLGVPSTVAAKRLYARNIWDLQVFDGRVYIGYGNSSNDNPATNSGPIPVTYYDPVSETFQTQNGMQGATVKTAIEDEQIDRMVIIEGDLFFLSHDPREGWDFANTYRLRSGDATWTKTRNIPKSIHIYDMASFNGRLFVGGSWDIAYVETDYETFGSQVWMSADDGVTWTPYGAVRDDVEEGRMYGFFELGGKLYATAGYDFLENDGAEVWLAFVMEINPDFTKSAPVLISQTNLFPGTYIYSGIDPRYQTFETIKIQKPQNFLGKAVYLATVTMNDHQCFYESLVILTSLTDGRAAIFPDPTATPTDFIIRDEWMYVCTFVKTNLRRFQTIVYRTKDLVNWEEVTRFNYTALVRAMEELDGYFYFGVGSYVDYYPQNIGTILRVKNPLM
jgi:hypothetical protein